jgi:hypothetical protein
LELSDYLPKCVNKNAVKSKLYIQKKRLINELVIILIANAVDANASANAGDPHVLQSSNTKKPVGPEDAVTSFPISCLVKENAQIGAVSFIQTFGSTLNFHPHFHLIVADGVFK